MLIEWWIGRAQFKKNFKKKWGFACSVACLCLHRLILHLTIMIMNQYGYWLIYSRFNWCSMNSITIYFAVDSHAGNYLKAHIRDFIQCLMLLIAVDCIWDVYSYLSTDLCGISLTYSSNDLYWIILINIDDCFVDLIVDNVSRRFWLIIYHRILRHFDFNKWITLD